ncbi:MAG: undecaprenyldiphospho-muramoylpentapeptide beta-N-acetylglucosaminyltransferase [Desulfobacterales bacterium]|nr:undecaprenyldiphospho-muramoylpentapeptide beta-N-acetylglucosaminyltransferase [Desulfobacterales bacterium]MBF0396051.1 undecaprenyldiphospho-muramoylpentapeptide beta-N-acetylglucosaminyltransferase [Desulfobacterales bacterium]
MNRQINVIIAGGGTGGHLFPGIAIAQAFIDENQDNKILFITVGKPFEVNALSNYGFNLEQIKVEGIKGKGIIQKIKSILILPKSIYSSIKIIKRFKPDIVVGVGGYISGPVVISAWLMGIKTVLHEQNSIPGITNRVLSKFVKKIFISFIDIKRRFNQEKVCLTGNPVRKELLSSLTPQKQINNKFTILILGGSQGARSINKAITDALEYIKEKEGIFFIHQTGVNDEDKVREAYLNNGIDSEVSAFFNDMKEKYLRADLVICRSGATTCAEITAIGKPAVFIPFPFATDNHQFFNAKNIVDAGGGEMILEKELTGKILGEKINYYFLNKGNLSNMAQKAKSCGRPSAAEEIVCNCYSNVLGE